MRLSRGAKLLPRACSSVEKMQPICVGKKGTGYIEMRWGHLTLGN